MDGGRKIIVKEKYGIQKKLFDESDAREDAHPTTFCNNTSLAIHRWFRYSAGFSALWVRSVIANEKKNGRTHVMDPFAGSGTTLLEAEYSGVESYGVESHPFVIRVAQAKLCWRANTKTLRQHALSILDLAKKDEIQDLHYPDIINRCYPLDTLRRLDAIRRSWIALNDGSDASQLSWLALVSILRPCSPVGTANWQYLLPNKSKARCPDPYSAFEEKISEIIADMILWKEKRNNPGARILNEDARQIKSIPDKWANLIITSPPYANNYDYADATRLEMTFLGEIQGWGDLQDTVRKYLIRSCTQHVGRISDQTHSIIEDPLLAPIHEEIRDVCKRLEIEKENHGGKKQYHTMIASYFKDMAEVWMSLRKASDNGVRACFVIGDSAPYGIYVPVDRWLGELAISAGFDSYSFEKARDRNTKWKNRKHTVPLKEGYLWVEG